MKRITQKNLLICILMILNSGHCDLFFANHNTVSCDSITRYVNENGKPAISGSGFATSPVAVSITNGFSKSYFRDGIFAHYLAKAFVESFTNVEALSEISKVGLIVDSDNFIAKTVDCLKAEIKNYSKQLIDVIDYESGKQKKILKNHFSVLVTKWEFLGAVLIKTQKEQRLRIIRTGNSKIAIFRLSKIKQSENNLLYLPIYLTEDNKSDKEKVDLFQNFVPPKVETMSTENVRVEKNDIILTGNSGLFDNLHLNYITLMLNLMVAASQADQTEENLIRFLLKFKHQYVISPKQDFNGAIFRQKNSKELLRNRRRQRSLGKNKDTIGQKIKNALSCCKINTKTSTKDLEINQENIKPVKNPQQNNQGPRPLNKLSGKSLNSNNNAFLIESSIIEKNQGSPEKEIIANQRFKKVSFEDENSKKTQPEMIQSNVGNILLKKSDVRKERYRDTYEESKEENKKPSDIIKQKKNHGAYSAKKKEEGIQLKSISNPFEDKNELNVIENQQKPILSSPDILKDSKYNNQPGINQENQIQNKNVQNSENHKYLRNIFDARPQIIAPLLEKTYSFETKMLESKILPPLKNEYMDHEADSFALKKASAKYNELLEIILGKFFLIDKDELFVQANESGISQSLLSKNLKEFFTDNFGFSPPEISKFENQFDAKSLSTIFTKIALYFAETPYYLSPFCAKQYQSGNTDNCFHGKLLDITVAVNILREYQPQEIDMNFEPFIKEIGKKKNIMKKALNHEVHEFIRLTGVKKQIIL